MKPDAELTQMGTALLLSSDADGARKSQQLHYRIEHVRALSLVFHAERPNAFWAMQIDDAVRGATGPIVVVAHGACCLAFAHWAQLSPASYTAPIAGAVLHLPSAIIASPPPGVPASSPRMRLPFPSLLVSDASPQVDAVLAQADVWGSRFIDAAAHDSVYRSDLRGNASYAERALMTVLLGRIDPSESDRQHPRWPQRSRAS
ncbi:alpha/beta hydrolase [Sphingomonas endolithica]|uniref:alpha/beta hydrolase n=1 Tax=Sphingomonas endolithica TaxID=2972485 RepID=UPI0021AF03FE|nr:alpha/beta hydrolase [Sphingomonas sp. ZFBP2030]